MITVSKKINFDQRVWELLKEIPKGKITTYKSIAEKMNSKAYRAVGQACKRNKNAPSIPCHRVVNSNGFVGYYSADGGMRRKIELLSREGIEIKNNKIENFEKVLYKF